MGNSGYLLHGGGHSTSGTVLEFALLLLPVLVVAGALLVSRLRSRGAEIADEEGETRDSYGDEPV